METTKNIQDRPLHHAIWTDLNDLYQHLHRQIVALERELAGYLVQTPYVRLMAVPGINVVSAPASAAETAQLIGLITQRSRAADRGVNA